MFIVAQSCLIFHCCTYMLWSSEWDEMNFTYLCITYSANIMLSHVHRCMGKGYYLDRNLVVLNDTICSCWDVPSDGKLALIPSNIFQVRHLPGRCKNRCGGDAFPHNSKADLLVLPRSESREELQMSFKGTNPPQH